MGGDREFRILGVSVSNEEVKRKSSSCRIYPLPVSVSRAELIPVFYIVVFRGVVRCWVLLGEVGLRSCVAIWGCWLNHGVWGRGEKGEVREIFPGVLLKRL